MMSRYNVLLYPKQPLLCKSDFILCNTHEKTNKEEKERLAQILQDKLQVFSSGLNTQIVYDLKKKWSLCASRPWIG